MTFTVHIAQLESRNFDFEAYGATEEAARGALDRALAAHATQYKLPVDWAAQGHEVTVRIVALGAGYRDRELLAAASPTVEELAAAFSAVLRRWLTPEQMAEAIVRNRTGEPGVCHTHDYCDANMAMDEAFKAHGLDPFSDSGQHLWNAAWDVAKAREFAVSAEAANV